MILVSWIKNFEGWFTLETIIGCSTANDAKPEVGLNTMKLKSSNALGRNGNRDPFQAEHGELNNGNVE